MYSIWCKIALVCAVVEYVCACILSRSYFEQFLYVYQLQ